MEVEMNEQRVTIRVEDGIADVRLSRADKLNAIDPPMFAGIAAAIDELAALPGLRAVVLSGEGRAFCAGLDMASMVTGGSGLDIHARDHGDANLVQQVAWGWRQLPVPVIAAIRGVCFGGGMQIASGADIRTAAPDARFAIMEMKWGIVPDMAGYALWRTVLRDDVLRELSYTAREVGAEEALRIGLVTRIADDPHAEAMGIARAIANRHPKAIRAAKRLANLAVDASAASLLLAESDEQARLLRTPDQIEAVRANMEKRPPVFGD